MSVKVSISRICDRCEKPFDLKQQDISESLPTIEKNVVSATMKAGASEPVVLFRFEDLCGECDTVVSGLIDRVRMDEKKEAAPKSRRKQIAEKAEAAAKESAPTGNGAAKEPEAPKDPAPTNVAAVAAAVLAAQQGNSHQASTGDQPAESSEPY